MSLLGGNDLKEQQKINELELKINREKQKLDKKLTRKNTTRCFFGRCFREGFCTGAKGIYS